MGKLTVTFGINTVVIGDSLGEATPSAIAKSAIVKLSAVLANNRSGGLGQAAFQQQRATIQLHLPDSTVITIPLGAGAPEGAEQNPLNVSNQPTWTNDATGLQAAFDDINAWLNT